MPVTKETVLEEAKKLGLTLSDAQIDAYVLIGQLPVKAPGSASGNNASNTDDDLYEPDLTEGMRKRLAKVKERQEATQVQLTTALAELQKFKDDQAALQRSELEKKGEYEKLCKELETAKGSYTTQLNSLKDQAKSLFVEHEVKVALLAAGCPSDRLPKALRLFDLKSVNFKWADETKYEGEVEGLQPLVESFKKDNSFLFEGDPNQNPANLQGARYNPSRANHQSLAEKAKEDVKKKHPRLFS